jgi:dienelactone hydrolase
MKAPLIALFSVLSTLAGSAALVEENVEYKMEGVTLEGFHVYDDAVSGQRPSVLVIHQWTGLTDYEKGRSRQLAELGYNVFAADIYGKGVRPQPPEAGKYAGQYKGDRTLYRARLMKALDVLKADDRTDPSKIAAIGYCFGGTGVLELARAGADIAGVVSFHGGLDSKEGMTAPVGGVKAKVLVLHGADDPTMTPAVVTGFQEEMRKAKADWQFVAYSGTVHAFTEKEVGNDNSKGVAYNAQSDARSWQAMKDFFAEIFGK